MKRLLFSALWIAWAFLLAGCANKLPAEPAPTYEEISTAYAFADTLPETDLPRPQRTIASAEDFVYALDYLAFYRIDREVAFDVAEAYAATFAGIYREFSRVLNITSLADVYPVNLVWEHYAGYRIIAVDLRITPIAGLAPEQVDTSASFLLPFDYNPQRNARSPDFEDFPLYNGSRGSVSVETGEQLWYAVNLGYRPLPEEGSAAEGLLDAAESVLRRIVSDEMDDYERCKAIYQYLTCEIRYDRATAAAASPDAVNAQCYYLEGVFFNRYAVCDGKAKAYCLLAGLEGIPAVRVTDFKENFVGHAYNYVKIQGNWYLSCTTFGASVVDFGTEEAPDRRIVPQYNMFLTSTETPYGDAWGYDSQMYPEIRDSIEEGFFDYWGYTDVPVGSGYQTLAVSSAAELTRLLEGIAAGRATMENTIVEFRLEAAADTVDAMMDAVESAFAGYEVQFLQCRPAELQIYSAVFLGKKAATDGTNLF